MMAKLRAGKKLECGVWILFVASFCVVSAFHEPWFDEAQAWEIAKGASLREILFLIPHYEGHPPLWHIILAIPAKLGVPYEIGLKTVGAIISIASASALIFRSRLPRIVRLLLPFSYFFFYQYGVVTRPYGLMLFVLVVLGMNLSERNTHPWRIFSLLAILCLCSAFGIVIAGGISICIVMEVLKEKGVKETITQCFKDPRTFSLLVLLALACVLLLEILPESDTYYPTYEFRNSFLVCLICALFTLPGECFLTSASWFSVDRTLLQTYSIRTPELLVFCLIGVILWLLFICSASKKSLKYLLIPYFLVALFSARVYFSGHHIGIIFMFFLFWAEYISRQKGRFEIGKQLVNRIATKENDIKMLNKAYAIIGIACLVVPISWTVVASFHDCNYAYYYSKEAAEFIKDNNLDDCLILGSWYESGSLSPFSEGKDEYVNTVLGNAGVPINAYFDRNIFFNLNHGNKNQGFTFHRRPTFIESETDLEEWRSYGYPDIIVGMPDLTLVYGDELTYNDYKLVAFIRSKFVWKANVSNESMPIFLRNDLLDAYHLVALEGIEYTAVNGLQITDEIKERFYNGEPMEEILKPYLDAMFGEAG